MLLSLRRLLDQAAENNYAVAGFNVYNLETIQAVYEVSHELNSPVLLQLSWAARQYMGDEVIFRSIRGFHETYPHLPLVIHQDHGHTLSVCLSAIQKGATSVMRDGSLGEDRKTPLSFEENVRVTQEAVQICHPLGVSVEGELGCLGSLETFRATEEDGHGASHPLSLEDLLTDPEQAKDFCKETKVDALAVAIGTSHGAQKFSRPPSQDTLNVKQLKKLAKACPHVHFVLHGASTVSEDLQERYRLLGGGLKKTWGVSPEHIRECLQYQVRKINIDTDSRLAFSVGVRQYLQDYPEDFNPRSYLKAGIEEMKNMVREKLLLLNQAEKASFFQS